MKTSRQIKYYKGNYKYQLAENLFTNLNEYDDGFGLWPDHNIFVPFIKLYGGGWLELESGYASDGPSGPTWDRPSFMRGAFNHDGLYQLMRLKLLDHNIFRRPADTVLANICKQDGMWKWWADNVVENGVKLFAEPSAEPKNNRILIVAP
jgi:hypothetical protein